MLQENSRSGVGGAGTEAGVSYEDRVGAWVEVEILAEGYGYTKFDLDSGYHFGSILRQREKVPDDILIKTSKEGCIYCQATKSVKCTVKDPKLRKTFTQFLIRFFSDRESLDTQKHRLALITISKRQQTITEDLREALNKVRKLLPDQSLDDLLLTPKEEERFKVVREITESLWQERKGKNPTDAELKEFLSHVVVAKIEVERGQDDHKGALDSLANTVLAQRERAEDAWSALLEISEQMAKNRSGANQSQLRKELQARGYKLKSTPSYEADIENLKRRTSSTRETLERYSKIEIDGGSTIRIKRECTDRLIKAVKSERSPIAVVGEPGAGKSGLLSAFVDELCDGGYDVLALSAGSLLVSDYEDLKGKLRLDHYLEDVLENWSGSKPGVVVIDGLDAAREDTARRALNECIRRIAKLEDSRWRIVASIREYDLSLRGDVGNIFRGEPILKDSEETPFPEVRHIYVRPLNDQELAQIAGQEQRLYSLVRRASSELKGLLRNLYNLSLMADLIGEPKEEILKISNQIEFLDLYWNRRVIRGDDQRDAREYALEVFCGKALQKRDLKVGRRKLIKEHVASETLADLLSHKILMPTEDESLLSFPHHILHDFAVAKLLLGSSEEALVEIVGKESKILLEVYPALRFYFGRLWLPDKEKRNTERFWDTVFKLFVMKNLPTVAKLACFPYCN